jgi:hypothetical protein
MAQAVGGVEATRYRLIGNSGSIEGSIRMRVICAAAMIAMLAGPAYAQGKPPTLEEMMDAKTPDQIQKEQAADKAYKDSLKKIPDAKTPADPWGNARSADAPKATAKTPAAKKSPAKIGNTAN